MATFPAPEDFEIPEGVKPGDTFSAMADLRLEADGNLSLVSLDGCDCESEEDDSEDDGEGEDEMGGMGKGPHDSKGFLNQIEIKLGAAGLD